MMCPSLWIRLAPIAFAPMIANCAGSSPISTAAPPRLTLGEVATRPFALATLPERPSRADLDAAYAVRGAQIVSCDAARRLAVETLAAERELQIVGGGGWCDRAVWRRFSDGPPGKIDPEPGKYRRVRDEGGRNCRANAVFAGKIVRKNSASRSRDGASPWPDTCEGPCEQNAPGRQNGVGFHEVNRRSSQNG